MSYDENRISDQIDSGLNDLYLKEKILNKVFNHVELRNLWGNYTELKPIHFRYSFMDNIISWDEYDFYFDLNKSSVYVKIQ
jgi:hypothetical protein